MTNRLKLCFLLIVIGIVFAPILRAQGLKFYGNKEPIDQRTTLLIFNKGNIPVFSKCIDISFELKIQDFDTFGYLLHVVDSQTGTAYSLTYTYIDKGSSAFKFNIEGKANVISMDFANESIKSKWIPVTLRIDLPNGESSLAISHKAKHGTIKTITHTELKPQIVFGKRENLVDVPSFAIRSLKISELRHSYDFPLNESGGEDVHDATGKIRGKVTRPYWLLNDSYHWKKTRSIASRSIIGSKFNQKDQSILFINQDSLFRYNVVSKQLASSAYANKLPVKLLLGTNYIDESSNKIYSYEINNLPAGDVTIAALDAATLTWQVIGKAYTPVQLHHHNGFLMKDKRYIVFGGFGNRRYNNNFLAYNPVADHWDTLHFEGARISPRFFSSIGQSPKGDFVYIYGGVGNDSGDQTVGHNYYDDLYLVNMAHRTIKKCWGKHSSKKLVSSEQMILSDDQKYLFVIRYAEYNENTRLQLYRISIADGTSELFGDSIPYISKSIASNVALYYNTALQEFYCITQEFDDTNMSVNAHVFTLAAPAVNKAAIQLYSVKKSKGLGNILALIAFTLGIGCILFLYLKNKKRKKKSDPEFGLTPISGTEKPATTAIFSKISASAVDAPKKELIPAPELNRIYLFGIFTVYGRSGRDITHLFSNKLKHIFLYILMNSDSEGVNSAMLNSLFWPDKMEKQAKNLKGVTISNLRKALAEIDGIELVYEKGFFKIVLSEPCYCDYFHLHTLFIENSQGADDIFRILERGQLLECTQLEIFDKYKQQSEDVIFSLLPQDLRILYKKGEYKQVLRICSILLKMDPLHEPALTYCIYSYSRLNEHEKLFRVYALFASEYRNSMGQSYAKSLEALLQEANEG